VLAALLLLAAVVCGVIAAATWQDFEVEGAYLNRSIGAPAYAGVYSSWGTSDGPRILLGAAIALAVAGILVLAVSIIQARRRAPAPPAPAPGPAP
jgi:cytochrome c biogenesis factor